jgi:hypothetical protein
MRLNFPARITIKEKNGVEIQGRYLKKRLIR